MYYIITFRLWSWSENKALELAESIKNYETLVNNDLFFDSFLKYLKLIAQVKHNLLSCTVPGKENQVVNFHSFWNDSFGQESDFKML